MAQAEGAWVRANEERPIVELTKTSPATAAADSQAKPAADGDEDEVEEDVPEVDMALNEAKSVLCDLIRLSRGRPIPSSLAVTAGVKRD